MSCVSVRSFVPEVVGNCDSSVVGLLSLSLSLSLSLASSKFMFPKASLQACSTTLFIGGVGKFTGCKPFILYMSLILCWKDPGTSA